MPVARGTIKRVASGELGVAALLSAEQMRFLRDVAKLQFELTRLQSWGPAGATLEVHGTCAALADYRELWRRDDGALILEASIKAPIEQAAVAAGGFLAHLAEIGAERDHTQEAKTRWALDHYAGKARLAIVVPAPSPGKKTIRGKSVKATAAKPPAKKTGGRKIAANTVKRAAKKATQSKRPPKAPTSEIPRRG